MVHIELNKLKYYPGAITSCLKVDKEKNITVALKNVRIMFLDYFFKKNLAEISDYVTLVGYYAIIDDDGNYGVSRIPAMLKLLVDKIEDSTCTDGQLYKVLYINKGSILMDENSIVVTDSQLYNICEVFFINAKIPWYIEYNKLSKIFMEALKYCKSTIGKYRLVFEILASVVARGKNKSIYYRNSPEFLKVKPQWVDIKNIYYSLPSTSSKLIGGYYGAAVGVAILKPEKTISAVEEVLMGKINK